MVNSLETENTDLKARIQAVERKFKDIEKTVQALKKAVERARATLGGGKLGEAKEETVPVLDKEMAPVLGIKSFGLVVLAYYVWMMLEGTMWKWV